MSTWDNGNFEFSRNSHGDELSKMKLDYIEDNANPKTVGSFVIKMCKLFCKNFPNQALTWLTEVEVKKRKTKSERDNLHTWGVKNSGITIRLNLKMFSKLFIKHVTPWLDFLTVWRSKSYYLNLLIYLFIMFTSINCFDRKHKSGNDGKMFL